MNYNKATATTAKVKRNQLATILAFLILCFAACREPKTRKDETKIDSIATMKMTPTISDEVSMDGIETIYEQYTDSKETIGEV